MVRITLLLTVVILSGCSAVVSDKPLQPGLSSQTLLMNYSDFGPQAACYELLGMKWWQWQPQGDPDPDTEYDIRVIVYKNLPIEDVRQAFPVNPEAHLDYRYVSCEKAILYLDRQIEEDMLHETTERFRKTRSTLISNLCNQD